MLLTNTNAQENGTMDSKKILLYGLGLWLLVSFIPTTVSIFIASDILLRTELYVILLDLNPLHYRKAVCWIFFFVHHHDY